MATSANGAVPADIDATSALLQAHGYLAPRQLATALFLTLRRPPHISISNT